MPRVGFEPTISVGERPKTYALDRPRGYLDRLRKVTQILMSELTDSPTSTGVTRQLRQEP